MPRSAWRERARQRCLGRSLTSLYQRKRPFAPAPPPLAGWLESAELVSQNMLAGLLRGCVAHPPASTAESTKLGLAAMAYLIRRTAEKIEAEVKLMTTYINAALCKQYLAFKEERAGHHGVMAEAQDGVQLCHPRGRC